MNLPTVAWLVVTIFFAVMGVVAFARPAELLAPFGIRLMDADADAEVRGVYGGLGFAFAALLVYAALHDTRAAVAPVIAVALAGMSASRLVSILVRRPVRAFPTWFFVVVDAGIAGLTLYGARAA